MALLTTSGYNFEGYAITEYIGVYSGECALGTGFLSSLGASFADFFGSNSGQYSDKLKKAKAYALDELYRHVKYAGGNAIIGLDIDYTTFSSDVMGVIANGTAVKIVKINDPSNTKDVIPKKEFAIDQTNLITPFRSAMLIMDNPNSVALDISITEPGKLSGVMADIRITSIFNDIYEFTDLPFYGFENYSFRHSLSKNIELNIPNNLLPVIKSIDLIVKKYILNDSIIEVKNSELNSQSIMEIEDTKTSSMSTEDLLFAVEELNSAREIFDYLINYNEIIGGKLDSRLLSKIQELRGMEGIYGNMKSSALKSIRYFLEEAE